MRKSKYKVGDVLKSLSPYPIEITCDIMYKVVNIDYDEDDEEYWYDLQVLAGKPEMLKRAVDLEIAKIRNALDEKYKISYNNRLFETKGSYINIEFTDKIHVPEYWLEDDFEKMPPRKLKNKILNVFNKIIDKLTI